MQFFTCLINLYYRNGGGVKFIVLYSALFLVCSLFITPSDANYYFNGASNYCAWFTYFVFMLLGFAFKNESTQITKSSLIIGSIVCPILFYVILFLSSHSSIILRFSLVGILPLIFTVFCWAKLILFVSTERAKALHIYNFICVVSSLSLEIYLIQGLIISDILIEYFPLNVLFICCLILIASYFVRILGRLFMQVFSDHEINLRELFALA